MSDDASLAHHTVPYEWVPFDNKATTEGSTCWESAWVDAWKETECATAHYSTVELKLIIGDDCECVGVLELKLNHNRPFGSSIMSDVVWDQLDLGLYSEEVNHALDHNSRTRGVKCSRGDCDCLSSIKQLAYIESVLLECVIVERKRDVCFIEQNWVGSNVVGVSGIVEFHPQSVLVIIEEEVELREGALFYLDLRLSQRIVAANHICSISVPLSWACSFQELLYCNQVRWIRREIYLLLLNIPDHCSTTWDVMELRLYQCYVGSNRWHFNQVVVSVKIMPELTPFYE